MMRHLGAFRHWFLWLFLVLVVASLFTQFPLWAAFIPLVVWIFLPSPVAKAREPHLVAPPVTGRWVAINSPANQVPSHGVHSLGQAYAIDILHPTPPDASLRLGWKLAQRQPDEYSCFGAPVLAVAPGRVVKVLDRMPDHRARNTWPGVINMLTLEEFTRGLGGPRFVLGNHVVVDHGEGVFSLYAHLQRGSAEVRVGDEVAAGDQLGRVGNTGNTSEPHLHFQLMDRADASSAAGLPFRWSGLEFEQTADARWAPDGLKVKGGAGLPATGQAFTAP